MSQTPILISPPVASSGRLERLHLFAGRHLGEEEFDHLQAYADERLRPLLGGWQAGIVHGLEVREGSEAGTSEGFTVSPGLAVAGNGETLGLYYPLRQSWQALIEDYLSETGASDATGVYYLCLRRTRRRIDADPEVDPCQRTEFDPHRDSTLVVVGSLGLRRLSIAAAAVSTENPERLQNWVAADHVDGAFLATMSDAVPLGVVAVAAATEGWRMLWFSEAAGRYLATANSGYLVLLNQIRQAFRRVLAGHAGSGTPLADYLSDNLRLDFLPAAGELPIDLLQNPASTAPGVVWLPSHLGIDMVAVPEEGVGELIERHLPRRVVDLRQPAGDRLRLLLAVNEPDYRPDLLDIPQTDAQLENDLYRYFMRAQDSWREWMRQFNHLYFLTETDVLDADEIRALDLPRPIAAPQPPQPVFEAMIADAEATLPPPEAGGAPYPYSQGVPAAPAFYSNWLDGGNPPGVDDPAENGLVIRFAIARWELEALDNSIRAIRARLEKTRDYLLLQRQQLDTQTVSLASLAGGVAGDGSGLQVARWLPFTRFTAQPAAAPTPEEETAGTRTAATTGGDDLRLTALQPSSTFSLVSSLQLQPIATSPAPVKESPFATSLRQAPLSLSSVQYSLNASRLGRIAEAPKRALTKPAFEAKTFRFGVLEHVLPEIQEYKKAYRGMRELITTLDGLFDTADAKALKAKLEALGKPVAPETLAEQDKQNSTGDAETDHQNAAQARYEALFKAGQILTRQIAYVEGRYGRIEAQLEGSLRERLRKEALIDKLAALIEQATERLENLDKTRIERLGDYGVAQRLLDDDWRRVYEATEKRRLILTQRVLGLYFVRERQTPVSLPLADPLALRHGAAGDIVPGCDWVTDPELPEALQEFFDTVLEVPMADWAALKDLQVQLPQPSRLAYVYSLREARFRSRPQYRARKADGSKLHARLLSLSMQSQSVLQHWSQLALPTLQGSLKRQQQDSATVLSLEDVLAGTRGALRKQAQVLRDRLEQCIACLLEQLNLLPPSIRLQWAQLAEDDRIDVEHVNRWPSLERAERDDFNATRTVAELVDWWFRQLDSKASGAGHSALRSMIRACLIHAALGDPAEILHGEVQVPPRRLAVGEPLRLTLNRMAKPGTVLQLLDSQQRRVALLNIEDNDERGVTAQIASIERGDVRINTRFTVVASKMTQVLR